MKKTAIVLVGLAASTAAASAAPRLAAQERASARADTAPAAPSPADNFDAWLETSYGANERDAQEPPTMTEQAARLLVDAASTIAEARVFATQLLSPPVKRKEVRKERAPITYPRVDSRGDIVCANVSTKGGSKTECRDRTGMWVSPDEIGLEILR